jgi:hypothetical protein
MSDSSLNRPSSWVIVRRSTREPVFETWSPRVVAALDPAKAEAVPILDWLARVNAKARRL